MNKLIPHVPGFVEGEDREPLYFSSKAELLNLAWVKRFDKDDHTLCVSEDNDLMSVKDDGTLWWVVGFLDKPVDGLPVWCGPHTRPMLEMTKVIVTVTEPNGSKSFFKTYYDGSKTNLETHMAEFIPSMVSQWRAAREVRQSSSGYLNREQEAWPFKSEG